MFATRILFHLKRVYCSLRAISFIQNVSNVHETHLFVHHIKEKISKDNTGIGVFKKLNNTLSRKAPLTLYKSFVRPHLDYGEIIYDQPNNESFCNKLETVQYNAALAITGQFREHQK